MSPTGLAKGYDSTYERFNSQSIRQIRREAYGGDIGQHSWINATDLGQHVKVLGISATARYSVLAGESYIRVTLLIEQ